MQWLPGYNKRRKLTIPADAVKDNLTNVPVIINISDSSGINNADLTDRFTITANTIFFDNCSGSFSTNWEDKSCSSSSAYFDGGFLCLTSPGGESRGGANALLSSSFATTRSLHLFFDWIPYTGSWWDDNFTDAEVDVKVVCTAPEYGTTSWNYCRCERNVGLNTYLSLSLRSYVSQSLTIRQNLNGSVSNLTTVPFVHGSFHHVEWIIDFTAYTMTVIIDNITLIEDLPWDQSVVDRIGDQFKFNFHWHNYKTGNNTQKFDNIRVVSDILADPASLREIVITDRYNNPTFSEIVYEEALQYKQIMWARLPTLVSGVDNHFYLYYDKIPGYNVPVYSDYITTTVAKSVWGDDFTAVYHMVPLEDNPSQSIVDSSKNNIVGTLAGGLALSDILPGVIDVALDFNGSSDYIKVNDIYGKISETGNDITISVLFKFDGDSGSTAGYGSVLFSFNHYESQHNDMNSLILKIHEGQTFVTFLVADLNNNWVGDIRGSTDVCDHQWHYVMATYNDNTREMNLYVDGVLDISGTASSSWLLNTSGVASIGQEYDYSNPSDYFNGKIDELMIMPTSISGAYAYTTYSGILDNLIWYGDVEYLPGYTAPYRNIWVSDDYIFNCTLSGVSVYDVNANFLGHIFILERASSVWADDTMLYIGTTASGILKHPITSISGGIYTDLSVYKQYPDITDNGVNYINGAGGFICATTISGVDRIKIATDSRIKTSYNNDFGKCSQVSNGGVYYITHHSFKDFPYDAKYYRKVTFTGPVSRDDYQIKVSLSKEIFDFSHIKLDASDVKFYVDGGARIPHYVERVSGELLDIWIRPPLWASHVYMLYGVEGSVTNDSDPEAVFNLYDSFNSSVIDTSKWTIFGDVSKFAISQGALTCTDGDGDYILSSGTINFPAIVEQTIFKNHSDADQINYITTLVPYEEGLYWYGDTSTARKILFNGTPSIKPTTLVFADNATYNLTLTIAEYRIQMESTKDLASFINETWIGETSGLVPRRLKLFGGVSPTSNSFKVSLHSIRVRGYDPNHIVVSDISKEHLLHYSKLNVLYDPTTDWTENSLDYVYDGRSSFFPQEVQMNDVYVSEQTTTSGNTIFLATNEGATVIEEKRGDEFNSDVRFYKIV